MVDKITKAAPEKATAKPAAKRKLLACTHSVGYQHDTIPICAKMLEIMGTKTGAWETVISEDMEAFEPENLKQFDGVFFCVTTGPIFGDGPADKVGERITKLRKSLLEFVASGKGVGGNHGATDSCYNWPEYGEMMGAYFTEHPFGKIVVKNDDPASPVNAAFKEKGSPIQDEMYVFGPKPQQNAKQNYSREKMHVLLSIDVAESKLPDKNHARDKDYAISWIKPYEKGRVFYCSFGHERHITPTRRSCSTSRTACSTCWAISRPMIHQREVYGEAEDRRSQDNGAEDRCSQDDDEDRCSQDDEAEDRCSQGDGEIDEID